MGEVWLPYPEVPAYEVSSLGRVRRDDRIRKPKIDKDGYHEYALSLGSRKKVAYRRVHRMVAMTFLGKPPEKKPLVLHGDGNPGNNRVENLRWGDFSENQLDSIKHGTHWEAHRDRCIRDHDITHGGSNTYYDRFGKRSCLECRKLAGEKRRHRGR